MNYTINRNPEFNSLEISFPARPDPAILDGLKALKFRWHGVKKLWYGFADETAIRAVIDGTPEKPEEGPQQPAARENAFGVRVGDVFLCSWGYDQTNNDFFQVVALVGQSSVRVRQVRPPITARKGVSAMAEDRTVSISREMLDYVKSSWCIKDQEKGDLKRLKRFSDGSIYFLAINSHPARLCAEGETTIYESWYA